jgi:cytochrome P450
VAEIYDPYAYGIHDDPYPTYRVLRDEHPLYRNEERGFWALSRHDDVRRALHDPATYSSAAGVVLEDSPQIDGVVITTDPPRHTQLRALLSRAFTPRRIAGLEAAVQRVSAELLDGFVETTDSGNPIDLMAAYAKPIPTFAISELLGVPAADRAQLLEWSDAMLVRDPDTDATPPEALAAMGGMSEYMAELVRERRRRPGDDLMSGLVAAEVEGERLTDDELTAFGYLLFVAGNETTTSLIGNAVWYLDRHPEQLEVLRGQPDLLGAAVEELLRHDAPTQNLRRTTTRDVELHGTTIPKGDKVVLIFGAANRDPRAFPDPDRFDVRRRSQGHLAFGHGAHFCLGAALARMEARVAIGALYERAGTWTVVDDPPPRRVHSANQRGFATLSVDAAG